MPSLPKLGSSTLLSMMITINSPRTVRQSVLFRFPSGKSQSFIGGWSECWPMVGGSIIRFCPVEGSGKRLRFTKRVVFKASELVELRAGTSRKECWQIDLRARG
ncbi:orf103b (mitochondrion) [Beta vulgaris subsp. vulgaris]|uniref:Orf103b protein n=3 Tax=Beta TaxID=3554 RepID=Q9MFC0_BETVV|nr:orf103b [Beta vulgaris subsp. vulgaris]YP_004222363.1 hypothetical protein LKY74_mgp035 [Beta vulgaris subsp. maritima]YP_004842168.1 hypothetical protein LKY79_mgp037 [Beta macrocarpa]CBJ14003.1 hypothetical protein [Beta vulgaris subsp. maritima]CBJ17579.1 hypothetical protein [Beta vulgaris subsp. maritima]CBJ20696.1 hypothetical protein [Beta vulgaris subsp. maritima]CBL54144.1 hypothetical protein [Beta vulgaris subsp. maritima]CBX24973.1 hypothetical protein [Beta macrocarpa]